MTNKFFKSFCTLLIFTLFLSSCKKEKIQKEESKNSELDFYKELEREPYVLSNMEATVKYLEDKNGIEKGKIKVRATNLYIRYNLKTEEEIVLLAQVDTTEFFDHPIHGDFDIENCKIEEGPGYVYAVVPAKYQAVSGLEYEIIAQLYMPEEDTEDAAKNFRTSVNGEEELLDDLLVGTFEKLHDINSGDYSNAKQSKWRPAGQLKIEETYYTRSSDPQYPTSPSTKRYYVAPLSNIKVTARKGLRVKYGTTDANGYFSVSGMYKGKVRYKVRMERSEFYVRKGNFRTSAIDGPKIKGDWNKTFNDDQNQFYLSNYNGLYDYIIQRSYGFSSPVAPGWGRRITLAAKYKQGPGASGVAHPYINWIAVPGLFPELSTWLGSTSSQSPFRCTDFYYTTAVHECAHLNHYRRNFAGISLRLVDAKMATISESYAEFVGWYHGNQKYVPIANNRGDDYYHFHISNQDYIMSDAIDDGIVEYTPLFIDLVDDMNQQIDFTKPAFCNDNISGLSVQDIETIVLSSMSWQQAVDKTIDLVPYISDTEIIALYNHYKP